MRRELRVLTTAGDAPGDEPGHDPLDHEQTPVALTAKSRHPPIACTLDAGAMPDRIAAWRSILDHAVSRATTGDGGLRLELGPDLPLEELATLVAAEQSCCAFFSFAITVDDRGVGLEVSAPDAAGEVITTLFGEAV